MKSFFAPADISKVTGISYRQIQYWDRTGFLRPSYRRRGKYRLYTFSDLLRMDVVKFLRSEFSIQEMREKLIPAFNELLVKLEKPLFEMEFWFLLRERKILATEAGGLLASEPVGLRYQVSELRQRVLKVFPEPVAAPPPSEAPVLPAVGGGISIQSIGLSGEE